MRSKQEFLKEWIAATAAETDSRSWSTEAGTKRFHGTPALYAFAEMDYFALISEVGWTPESYEAEALIVPRGFVTDFASVPRFFWGLLPPMGRYGYAAVFHDYAYWQQTTSRFEADKLFRDTMSELQVSPWIARVLYYSVRWFGSFAWRSNAALKKGGEKRCLRMFPTGITTRWTDWKTKPGVFA